MYFNVSPIQGIATLGVRQMSSSSTMTPQLQCQNQSQAGFLSGNPYFFHTEKKSKHLNVDELHLVKLV